MKRFIALLKKLLFGEGGLFYINGPETLPPPLGAERERELLEHAGEAGARDELIVHNLRLVVYIARRFDCGSSNVEDLISIGTIGLMKAVDTFRTDRNIKLATYASRCIENEILMYLRKTAGQRGELSLQQPLSSDGDGNELLLQDVLGSDGEEVTGRVESESERQLLRAAISELPERDRRIMCMRYALNGGRELTQKEVADIMGISQSYISRLEKKILARLRRRLETA